MDLFDPSSYKYDVSKLDLRKQTWLFGQLTTAYMSGMVPPPFMGYTPCHPSWPQVLPMTPPSACLLEPILPDLQANPCGTPPPVADMQVLAPSPSVSLQHRASGTAGAVAGSSSSSAAHKSAQEQQQEDRDKDCDDLFKMFDSFKEEDLSDSLLSGDSLNTSLLNNTPQATPPGHYSTQCSVDTHASLGSETLAPTTPSTTPAPNPLGLDPLLAPPIVTDLARTTSDTLHLPQSVNHQANATCVTPTSHALSTLLPALHMPGCGVTPGTPAPAPSTPAARLKLSARTASLPLPGTSPAGTPAKVRQGGVRKLSAETTKAASKVAKQAVVGLANNNDNGTTPLAGIPARLGSMQLPTGAYPVTTATAASMSCVRGVGVLGMPSMPSAFASFAADPHPHAHPMPLAPLSSLPTSSGGVFTAASLMATSEDEAANDVLVNTSSMCHRGWMEDVSLAGPSPDLAV